MVNKPRNAHLDPDEELWFPVDWSAVLVSGETITASAWTAPADAAGDGHTMMDSSFADTSTAIKLTGGAAGSSYAWENTVDTLDGAGLVRKRQRTITIPVAQK